MSYTHWSRVGRQRTTRHLQKFSEIRPAKGKTSACKQVKLARQKLNLKLTLDFMGSKMNSNTKLHFISTIYEKFNT